MKVNGDGRRSRGRPKGSRNKNRRTDNLPTNIPTATIIVDKNAGSIVKCNDSNSSSDKSLIDVVSLSPTITNNISERSCIIQRKVYDARFVNLKDARVVLQNIFHSKLISPKQRNEILKRSYNSQHSVTPYVSKKKKQRKQKSKATSISSTTSGSSVIYLGKSTPIVTDSKFNPKLTLDKIKVEPLQITSEFKISQSGGLTDKNLAEQSFGKKPPHSQKKLRNESSITNKASTDRPISIHGSSSSDQLESKKPKKESRGVKQKRSETSFDGGSSFHGSSTKGRSRIKKSARRRRKNSSKVKSKVVKSINGQNSSNEGSKKTPKKNDSPKTPLKNVLGILQTEKSLPAPNITVNVEHLDHFYSPGINFLGNGNCSPEPPILSPKIFRIISPLACNNRAQVEICPNDCPPSGVCISRAEVEMRPDDKLPQASFANSEPGVGVDLDDKLYSLDSIAQAMDYDLAAGNRLSPLGDIEKCLEMPADLPADTCSLRKMIINGSTTADHPGTLHQDMEKSRNVSERGFDGHETSSNISSSTAGSESDRKRKRPAIIKDYILPKGTISVSGTNRTKKPRMTRSTVGSEMTVTNQNISHNLSANGNNEYIFINQSDVNLPSSIDAWSKCSEIEPLLRGNNANDRLSDKHDCLIDDALNNNQEVNSAIKNTLHSEKQEEKITLYATPTVVSPSIEEEYNALHGLLTSLSETDNPNSITKVDDCPELDNNHPISITKVGDCPELDNNHPNLITEVDDYTDLVNNVPNSIIEVDPYSELDKEEREVDNAIESFTASVNSSQMKNIKEKEKINLALLTVDNVEKFDCSGSATAAQIASPTRSLDTESSKDWQSEDMTECSSSIQVRRRRWVPREVITSPPAPSRKIRLNRGNWTTDRKEKTEFSSATGDSFAQPENRLETSKSLAQQSNNNDNKIEYSHRVIADTVTNNTFRKPISPVKYVQKRDDVVSKAVPGFGEGAINGVPESKSQTEGNSDDSSGSLSSSSSSDSSSSSSSSSSESDSSDDEDAPKKLIENIAEKATEKVNENFFQKIPKRITNNDPRNLLINANKPGNTGTPVSSIKSRGIKTTKQDKAQLVLEKVEDNEKAAGSLIDNDFGKDKKDEDQDDCISLFADSTCMSRCDSPPINEPPKRRRSPLYKQMKSSNIDSFANANKQQFDADLAEYKEKIYNDENDKKQQQNKNEQKKANEPRPNKDSMPSLDPTDEIEIRPTIQTVNKTDLRSTLNSRCEQEPKYIFFGQCFSWLKVGDCNQFACRYLHVLKPQLQRINSYQMNIIVAILRYAISNRYCFFIGVVHNQLVESMSTEQIINLYEHLYKKQLLTDMTIASTTEALMKRGMSLKEIVTILDNMIVSSDGETPNGIIRAVVPKIKEPGTLWETLSKVISKILPPVGLVEKLIEECINENKGADHLYDVNENLIKGLPPDFLLQIRDDLMIRFYGYLKNTTSLNANVANIIEPQHEPQENGVIACSIASPDSAAPSVGHTLPEHLTEVETSMTYLTSSPQVEESKAVSGSASQRSCTDSRASDYSMAPIDNLPHPKSPYADVLWKFHWDLQGVQEGLKHRDYTHVISILTQNMQHPTRLPHMAGFYNILCNEIMSSKQHLAEIVRLTVQSGASNDLRQFVFDLGVHVLTKLADIGTWVLGHELLKTFRVYGTYNTCAYTLLAAEIYIANYRPLKALELLKQSQIIFTNTKVWNQMRCPNDEPLRVTVMELLLCSLCDGHAQHALSLLEFILSDQCSSFKPINVSRYVDKIGRALLAEKHTSSIIDFSRVVIQANLWPSRSTFRALINSIFHNDIILAKQLHRYATLLGAYNTAKISRTTHMVINNDWTEEEVYLMFSSLIKDLSTNIGHAIGRLRPRQLAVFLILETIPTEKHLYLDICNGPTTMTAINKRKAIVRNVLEHFDPKIKLVQKSQGRLCKVQSASLVDYLKAGHFEH